MQSKISNTPPYDQGSDEDVYLNQTICGGIKLCQVPSQKMEEKLHKNIVAIIADGTNANSKGSGLLISRDLVLTCGHNFYPNQVRIQNEAFSIYVKQCGQLRNPYKIDKVYIPQQFISYPHQKNVAFDYALIKLTQKVQSGDFIPLKGDFEDKQQAIAIYGHPGQFYENKDMQTNIESVSQWGLKMRDKIVQIRHQKSLIFHLLSTLPGQSGSAIFEIENQTISVIGIHKGSAKLKSKGNKPQNEANVGKLLNQSLIDQLQRQCKTLGAEMFLKLKRSQQQSTFYKHLVIFQYKLVLNGSVRKVRFFGVAISKNLVLTTAHYFFVKQNLISKEEVQAYVQKNLQEVKAFRIQSLFIPQSFLQAPTSNIAYDYALVKLSQNLQESSFISLRSADTISPQQLTTISFFDSQASSNQNLENLSVVEYLAQTRLGIVQVKAFQEERNEIIYDKSFRSSGGSPLFAVQNNQISIVGIHKGIYKKRLYKSQFSASCGTALTKEVILTLQRQAEKTRAEKFNVHKEQIQLNLWLKRGQEDLLNQNYKSAIKSFSNALQFDSDNQEALFGLGVAYKLTNQITLGIKSLKQLLVINDKHQKGYNELGILLSTLNEWTEAIVNFTKALLIHYSIHENQACLPGNLVQKSKEQQKSYFLQTPVPINQNYAETFYAKARLLQKQNQNDEARKHLEKCLDLSPNYRKAKLLLQKIMNKS